MDFGQSVKNPFLFDDPQPMETSNEPAINPFLMGGDDTFSSESYSGINPFADTSCETSISSMNIFGDTSAVCNPFADPQPASELYSMDTTGSPFEVNGAAQPHIQESSPIFENRPPSPKPPRPRPPSPSSNDMNRPAPPRRPPPPSKETKDLLQTVIGKMEATTDTLQHKLQTTSTPCPSPGGGLHTSRSPTPDIQITSPQKEPDTFGAIFGQTIELSDQEMDEESTFPPAESSDQVVPTNTTNVEEKTSTPGEIDLFGESIQNKPRTTQDILSLFNKPKETPQVDLLSDEIISQSEVPTEENETSAAENTEELNDIDDKKEIIQLSEITEELHGRKQSIQSNPFEEQERKSITPPEPEEDHQSPTNIIENTTIQAEQTASTNGVDFKVEETNDQKEIPVVIPDSIEDHSETYVPEVVPRQPSPVRDIVLDNTTKKVKPAVPARRTAPSEFNIFSDPVQSQPPISTTNSSSGADSTGAMLFGTSAPAPNVGMSIFGAGDEASLDIFAESTSNTMINPFAPTSPTPTSSDTLATTITSHVKEALDEEFDAFSQRFDRVTNENTESSSDPFAFGSTGETTWGGQAAGTASDGFGFGDSAGFDPFLAMSEPPPPPQSTPRKVARTGSRDSDDVQMNVVIRPDGDRPFDAFGSVPPLAPPPSTLSSAFTDTTPRLNPFDKSGDISEAFPTAVSAFPGPHEFKRSESQETPPTPLFEEDQSVPLESFPRTIHDGRTWEMFLRQPNKKKITGQRFWKKIFVRMTTTGALQLYNNLDDKEPFQELPLQPCYSVSDIGAQQFDQFGKIFTVKVQYIFYKERPGVRPGQISKAERITNKISKFAQYAIAGDYEGVKEFASDVRKLGMPVEHAPQISQLLKLGTQTYEDLKVFASLIEEHLFKLPSNRERALTYKSEEVQLTAVDEMYVEQDVKGIVTRMIARVRIFFLGFLSGMPEVDLGINDMRKQGCEVVGRHDIIPVVTEEWIRLEDIEFHNTVNKEEFEKSKHIKFQPPDACYIELMRFRVRPPKNRELPLQVKSKIVIDGKKVEINCEILVPGFSGRKLGQVPCEDVAIRFPLPESWIYMFRVEKHFRYGSVKSAHRRHGKVKGIERIKGAVENPEAALMEVTSGQAKYEHQHRAIVWRMSRLPKEGQGAYTVHNFNCKMCLTAYDQIPPTLDRYCYLEFTMPATTVSHCVMRSVSATTDEPPEKYVRYLARNEYKIEIEFGQASGPAAYIGATKTDSVAPPKPETRPQPVQEESSSDDSD